MPDVRILAARCNTFAANILIFDFRYIDFVAKILILDDFGSENYSKWAFEKLYQIINWRYNRKLPTVITSPNDFGKRHDAMISRIQDPLVGQIIKIESVDYRVKGKR